MNNMYIINNGDLAKSIKYITGLKYRKRQDYYDENKLVYMFENTEEFKKALTYVNNCKKNYNK